MILPIYGLKYHKFTMPQIGEKLLLVKEKNNLFDENAVAAFNYMNEKIGYVSAKSSRNAKIHSRMKEDEINGRVWAIFPNQLLVEIDIPKNPPPNNCECQNEISHR